MNVIEKPAAGASLATNDFDRFRLRCFIENLIGTDELERREAPVDLADIAKILDGNPRAVHFLAAGPEQQELVGNVVSSRSRIARAFGVAPERLAAEIGRRLVNKPQIVEVSRAEAPSQEVVLTGEEADLTALHRELDHGIASAAEITS
jgi:3-polyprenyl-4-hydroxybenzoate decarboxylase